MVEIYAPRLNTQGRPHANAKLLNFPLSLWFGAYYYCILLLLVLLKSPLLTQPP